MKKLFILSLMAMACVASPAFARNGFGSISNTYGGKPVEFYNNFGTYQGQAKPNMHGGYDVYNNFGTYKGQTKPNYNGGYSTYNEFGTLQGYTR